jgi:hypothetical protein
VKDIALSATWAPDRKRHHDQSSVRLLNRPARSTSWRSVGAQRIDYNQASISSFQKKR